MESTFGGRHISFEDLQQRLIRFVQHRISNGEFTERGLARMVGVSQPQIHNVLKGKRKLSPELADRLLVRFGIGILDLFETQELLEQIVSRPEAISSCCWIPRKPNQVEHSSSRVLRIAAD